MTTIHIGQGNQPMRWLADVAVHKYDQDYNMSAGTPAAMKFQNGVEVDFHGLKIRDQLTTDDLHLFLYFKEDLANMPDKNKDKKKKK